MAAEGAFVKPLFSYNFNSLRYINGKIYELPLKDILLSSFLCLAQNMILMVLISIYGWL